VERDPVAIRLNVDAALVLRAAAGIDDYPFVLVLMPNIVDLDNQERVNRAVLEELIRAGIVFEDGEVHPHIAHWLRCLDRPDVELAVRIVETGAAPAVLRMALVRCDQTHVLAVRNDDQLVIQSLFAVPGQLNTLSAAVLAGMGACPPARFGAFTARWDLVAEATGTPEEVGRVWRELGADPAAARLLSAAEVVRAAEIVAYEHHDGLQAQPGLIVQLLDTREGRIVVSPSVSADGAIWLRYAPGDNAEFAGAIAGLMDLLPGGSWFETSRAQHV
jgi:hypothetical protein